MTVPSSSIPLLPTRLEIIPGDDIVATIKALVPVSTGVSVTCLPHHGAARTVRTALRLADGGYHVVPHLAAHSLSDRAGLAAIIKEFEDAGITEIFVVGGDARSAGPYWTGLALMEDIAEISGGGMKMGVAGYPEGHPSVSGIQLVEALRAKEQLASYLVTQICFSATTITGYVDLLRREGIGLPVWAGIAGAVSRPELISIARRIGVGESLSMLSRRGPLARRMVDGNNYSSARLLSDLAARRGVVSGIHLCTFNNPRTFHHPGARPLDRLDQPDRLARI